MKKLFVQVKVINPNIPKYLEEDKDDAEDGC